MLASNPHSAVNSQNTPRTDLIGETLEVQSFGPLSALRSIIHSHLLGRPLIHWLMLIALVIMWGSAFALTKIALNSVSSEFVVAGRILIACVVLFVFLGLAGKKLPMNKGVWGAFASMALIGNCLPYWLITWGQETVDSGLAGLLMALMPLLTLLLAHRFVEGERLERSKLVGFCLALVGVAILVGPEALIQFGGSGSALLAQLAIIAGALCYAINTIIARLCPIKDSLTAAAGTTLVAIVLFVPIGASDVVYSSSDLDGPTLIALGVLGIVCTALAPILYFHLIQIAGPTFLSLINYLIPLWALALGAIALGESPGTSVWLAALVIFSGIAISQISIPRISFHRTRQD